MDQTLSNLSEMGLNPSDMGSNSWTRDPDRPAPPQKPSNTYIRTRFFRSIRTDLRASEPTGSISSRLSSSDPVPLEEIVKFLVVLIELRLANEIADVEGDEMCNKLYYTTNKLGKLSGTDKVLKTQQDFVDFLKPIEEAVKARRDIFDADDRKAMSDCVELLSGTKALPNNKDMSADLKEYLTHLKEEITDFTSLENAQPFLSTVEKLSMSEEEREELIDTAFYPMAMNAEVTMLAESVGTFEAPGHTGSFKGATSKLKTELDDGFGWDSYTLIAKPLRDAFLNSAELQEFCKVKRAIHMSNVLEWCNYNGNNKELGQLIVENKLHEYNPPKFAETFPNADPVLKRKLKQMMDDVMALYHETKKNDKPNTGRLSNLDVAWMIHVGVVSKRAGEDQKSDLMAQGIKQLGGGGKDEQELTYFVDKAELNGYRSKEYEAQGEEPPPPLAVDKAGDDHLVDVRNNQKMSYSYLPVLAAAAFFALFQNKKGGENTKKRKQNCKQTEKIRSIRSPSFSHGN